MGGQVVGREVESRVATVERISGGCKFQPGWNSIQQNLGGSDEKVGVRACDQEGGERNQSRR